MYLLDTDSLIYFFKGEGQLASRMLATPPGSLAIPAVALFELEVGIAKSTFPERRRQQLAQLLTTLLVVPFGASEATIAGRLRAGLELAGTPIGVCDILIAATALRHAATLVTRNVKEFRRVDGLVVEDWYGA
jgi:tRNA(fMet)-specific endonuclease VapC